MCLRLLYEQFGYSIIKSVSWPIGNVLNKTFLICESLSIATILTKKIVLLGDTHASEQIICNQPHPAPPLVRKVLSKD